MVTCKLNGNGPIMILRSRGTKHLCFHGLIVNINKAVDKINKKEVRYVQNMFAKYLFYIVNTSLPISIPALALPKIILIVS